MSLRKAKMIELLNRRDKLDLTSMLADIADQFVSIDGDVLTTAERNVATYLIEAKILHLDENNDEIQWNPYKQLCCWPGTTMGESTPKDFEEFMAKAFNGVRVKFDQVVLTLPDKNAVGNPVPGTGERSDLFFYVHEDDVAKFAVPRLRAGIKWWEDVLGNGHGNLYPQEFHDTHPTLWDY